MGTKREENNLMMHKTSDEWVEKPAEQGTE